MVKERIKQLESMIEHTISRLQNKETLRRHIFVHAKGLTKLNRELKFLNQLVDSKFNYEFKRI